MSLAPTIPDIRRAVAAARAAGQRIALVPTMGALHAGHAELIRVARTHCEFVAVSVFVNPTQFGPTEDFARYPRALDADIALAAACGAAAVFAPDAAAMYPPGFATAVELPSLAQELCGPSRPGHFAGVATVVLKLFNIVAPDVAVFGAKDAQQARVLKHMVLDLNLPIEMVIAPTVRDPDGLALSSRNRYLSADERAAAPGVYRALSKAKARVEAGERSAATIETGLRADLAAIPGARVEYAQVVDDESMAPLVAPIARPVLVACAVHLGRTRLIDNVTASSPA